MLWTPGKELQKGYRIESILGQGGFGIAYKATHLQLNHQVVIKTPNISLQNDPEYPKFIERFKKEGQILAQLASNHHPAIVRVSDLFEEEGILCLVMDLIVGESLWDIVKKNGALSEEKAVPIIRQIGEALIIVHQAGIIHRDAHPGNILLRNNGGAVLIDFGIAAPILPTGVVNSSKHPAHQVFAPYEQFIEGMGKPCVDVYCLASSLYYIITGKRPTPALHRKLRNASLEEPKQLVRISERVNNAILKGMEIEPENRPQTMEEFLALFSSISSQSVIIPEIEQSIKSESVVIKPSDPTITSPSHSLIPTEKAVKVVPFSFEIVKVNTQGEIISRQGRQAQYFTENLGNDIILEMVYIPGGTFIMGSPKGEGYDSEKPQHRVDIEPFYMAKYPITQEQYEAIMGTNPSYFKGAKRPVEQVSWDDAIMFCENLSQKTGTTYHLPSEAQWEYACRARTRTPFYFGETITPDLVNYDGNNPYGNAPKGKYRQQTTDVGSFPPNAFGLYDMHGNVWEWCQDTWHDNYKGAPTDGSSWKTNVESNNRVRRGGSWYRSAIYCRGAYRYRYSVDVINRYLGFRVAIVAWALPLSMSSFNRQEVQLTPKQVQQNPQLSKPVLQTFSFEIVKVNAQGEIISRQGCQAQYFAENLGNGIILEMVYIPGGTFLMGSPEGEGDDYEKPQHRVDIEPFYMAKYPITQEQYEAIMGTNPSYFTGAKRPVEQVSWDDAIMFCENLSQKTGKTYSLPCEAQWEYACRARTTTPFYFGETITPDLVNYDGNNPYGNAPKGVYRQQTTDVGSFPPNAFGLYDMHGNVWEWCQDTWLDNYNGAPTNGSSWEIGRNDNRVLRGGSWYLDAVDCRSADRNWISAVNGVRSLGFRVAIALDFRAASSSVSSL